MTIGAIIFAQNNSSINYVKIAIFSASQVQKHLKIPVSLITDKSSVGEDLSIFDNVIYVDEYKHTQHRKFYDGSVSSTQSEWKNFTRSQIYDLTPYNRTLVIDSDYIINSSVLLPALHNDCEFQIYKNSFDLANWRDTSSFNRINQYSIPFYWATVFIFEKNKITEAFFTLVSHIKENWQYYRILYSIDSTAFRNDFAFSIAIHIMNDSDTGDFETTLPGSMSYITDRDLLVSIKDAKMQFLVEKQGHYGEYTLAKTNELDVHVMNKKSLLRYIQGGSGV